VINASTNTVTTTVLSVGSHPYGVAYGNGYVYVANYNSNTVTVLEN
jgi:DNA-binding beta-propeller fold protein YncE